ncbi:MAG: hypothetical protein EHM48_05110, partial [Planctomycetaceae bacterium]
MTNPEKLNDESTGKVAPAIPCQTKVDSVKTKRALAKWLAGAGIGVGAGALVMTSTIACGMGLPQNACLPRATQPATTPATHPT